MILAALTCALIQNPQYASDIAAFQAADLKNPPAKGQTLFIGSSSFTRWTDAQSYFPTHHILNRAFGGSTLLDVTRFVKDVVYPYQPKQVVMYCGENDIANDPKIAAFEVVDRFKTLFGLIRAKYPKVPFAYVAMKPSPSRWHLRPKYIMGNKWIAEFLATQPQTAYVDIWDVMLGPDGRPMPDIFVGDNLHMNAKGYKIWAPLIEKVLE